MIQITCPESEAEKRAKRQGKSNWTPAVTADQERRKENRKAGDFTGQGPEGEVKTAKKVTMTKAKGTIVHHDPKTGRKQYIEDISLKMWVEIKYNSHKINNN